MLVFDVAVWSISIWGFFRPQQGTVILFRSAWLQHCTMPVRGKGRQLGCALYLRKQTLPQYVARQADLSRINRALNESMRTQSSTRRREKRKMGPLEGALRITYRGNALDICEEAWSVLCWVISWVTLSSIKYYLPEISFIPLTHFRFPHITVQFLH
jgi:hypothetical protein